MTKISPVYLKIFHCLGLIIYIIQEYFLLPRMDAGIYKFLVLLHISPSRYRRCPPGRFLPGGCRLIVMEERTSHRGAAVNDAVTYGNSIVFLVPPVYYPYRDVLLGEKGVNQQPRPEGRGMLFSRGG
jgi:hypothetical protein